MAPQAKVTPRTIVKKKPIPAELPPKKSNAAAGATPKPVKTKKPAAKKPAAKSRTTRKTTPKKPASRSTGTTRSRKSRAPKPVGLECSYSGKVFRSRLEARWALYLDLLGIDWDYEPCHYKLSDTLYYLPDFYLPQHRIWVEVKGAPFFDAESHAKVVNGVAGTRPLPTRNAPYEAAGTIIMGGTFQRTSHSTAPEHIAVIPGPEHTAHFVRMMWAPTDTGWTPAIGSIIDRAKASGTKAARRPLAAQTKAILEPSLGPGPVDPRVLAAYQSAGAATFDDIKKTLIPPAANHTAVSFRRAGRYLPAGL